MRLDVYLVNSKLCESREKAQRLISRHCISVNGKIASKSSMFINENDIIKVEKKGLRFVSVGGEKMEKALREFNFNVKDITVLDVGASTGGFTDCLLQYGAKLIYAIDVGTKQIHASLLSNKNVISIENKDIRSLTPKDINNTTFELVTVDLSFISLESILPYLKPFLKADGKIIALIKPQFETKGKIKMKNGIIRDKKFRDNILNNFKAKVQLLGFKILQECETDVEDDKKKNIEFLLLLSI
jgi:23S rRNA (cytidine1920-2'-O)/16S rRNA (cytidine1409-2'-O)-methyltransferase